MSFTKALALHSIYFWPSIELGLKELHRVLRPGGTLAIGVRMHEPTAGLLNPSRYGLTIHQVEELRTVLGAGFTDVDIQTRKLGRETIAAILVRR